METSIGTGTLSDGVATFDTSTLAVGGNTITAEYQGDTNFDDEHVPGRHGDGRRDCDFDHDLDRLPHLVGLWPDCDLDGDGGANQPRDGHADGDGRVLQR